MVGGVTADGADPHDVLGVPHGASAADVQAAYRRLARRYHPDAPDGGDPARMRTLNAAYAALRTGSPPPRSRAERRFSADSAPETATDVEDRRPAAPARPPVPLPSRRVVVVTLVALAALVAGLATLAATGDEVLEPRTATVTATGVRFVPPRLRLRSDAAVEIRLINPEPGQRHNIVVERGGTPVARGAPTTGPTAVAYEFGPLPAATYALRCEIVPSMTGTLTVT